MTDEGSFWQRLLLDGAEGFRVDSEKVRKVELRQEPRSREGVRVTVVSARGHIKVFTAPKSVLAGVIEELYAAESEAGLRD